MSPRFIHSTTAATIPPPIERALETDVMSVLKVYQPQYSNTDKGQEGLTVVFFLNLVGLFL